MLRLNVLQIALVSYHKASSHEAKPVCNNYI